MKNYIEFHPGEETAENRRSWQGCPTIARTRGGRLFAGWYTGGMLEPCIDNYNVLVKSDDNGESWSSPILAIYTDREKRIRNIDIQLWIDPKGALWVMWTHSPYPEDAVPATIRTPFLCNYHREFTGVEALICLDPDAENLVFEDPRTICFGFLRCKPTVLSDGRWIFPAYDWVHEDTYMLRVTEDEGKSFYDLPAAHKEQNCVFDETMVYETPGELRLLARTNLGYYAASESKDRGLTWSATHPYEPAPSTRMYIARLKNGMLAYVRNISDTERTGMKIALSKDDGATWFCELVLDERPSVSYPDLAEGEDGVLYIVHDRERDNRAHLDRNTWKSEAAKEILLSRITIEDIMNGTLGKNSFVAKVISKGYCNFVEK